MLSLTLTISDVDYDSLFDLLMPVIVSQMNAKGHGLWGDLLSKSQSVTGPMARAFWNRLPREKKEEMVVNFLNGNRFKIKETLEQEAKKNGISLTVADAEAKIM